MAGLVCNAGASLPVRCACHWAGDSPCPPSLLRPPAPQPKKAKKAKEAAAGAPAKQPEAAKEPAKKKGKKKKKKVTAVPEEEPAPEPEPVTPPWCAAAKARCERALLPQRAGGRTSCGRTPTASEPAAAAAPGLGLP